METVVMRSAAGSWWREARIAEKETRDAENSQGEEESERGEDGKQQHLAGCYAFAKDRVEADVCFQ